MALNTHKHTEITSIKDKASLLAHPLVRGLAYCFQEFKAETVTELYKLMGYYVSDAPGDMTHLENCGILRRTQANYYNPSRLYVSLVVLPEILNQGLPGFLKVDELPLFRRNVYYGNYYGNEEELSLTNIRYFADAINSLVIGLSDFDIKILRCEGFLKKLRENASGYFSAVIHHLLGIPKYSDIFYKSPKRAQEGINQFLADAFADMNTFDPNGTYRQYFFNPDGSAFDDLNGIIYVLQAEVFTNGHIDKVINRYKDAFLVHRFLTAVKSMHAGNLSPMFDVMTLVVEDYGSIAYAIPAIAMYFCGAIMLNTSPESSKMASKILRDPTVKSSAALTRALLTWKTKSALSQKLIDGIVGSLFNPSSQLIFTIFALHFHFFSNRAKWPAFMNSVITYLQSSQMKYILMLLAEEYQDLESKMPELQKVTDMRSFLNPNGKSERWQQILEQIQSQCGTIAQSAAKDSRVAYLVSYPYLFVQPIVQKATATGKWTKGRNIALSKFRLGEVEDMTSQDAAVAKCVVMYDSWSGKSYELNNIRAVAALAGHPNVFTDDEMRLKIDIVEEPLQLSVTRNKNGDFKITANVNLDKVRDGIYIDSRNPTSLRVVKLDEKQKILLSQLLDLGNLPARAEKALSSTLNALGKKMTIMSDLMGANSDAKQVDASSKIVAQLLPDDELIRVTLFAKPLEKTPPYLIPGKGSEYVSGRFGGELVQAQRDLAAEKENQDVVLKALIPYENAQTDDNVWLLDIEQTLGLLDSLNELKDNAFVEWPEGVKMKINRGQLQPGNFHFSIKKSNDWFTMEGEVEIDDKTKIKISDLLSQLGSGNSRFIRLGNDEYVALSQQLAKLLRGLSQLTDDKGKHLKISPFHASLIDQLEESGIDLKADRAYRNLIKRIEEADQTVIKTPTGLQADLRDYQKEGYRWMARLNLWGAGACLADDMGLGKTLQTIALLYSQRKKGPSLVIAPTSILLNWQDEIVRFAPQLNTKILNPVSDSQRAEVVNEAQAGDVVITSYGLMVTQQEILTSKQWNIIVLDEAHTIKNRETKMSKAAMQLKGDMRIALTGTPLQNRLAEIWNIFQFINPGLLGSFQSFTERFIVPIERDDNKERQRLLKRMISPFMLRRTKSDVLNELPEKTEIQIKVNLSNEERALYESLRARAESAFESGEQSAIEALAEITKLRQAACNPRLVNPSLTMESSKTAAFMELVENLQSNNHRALVFSQFTSHLALIREALDAAGYQYLYLDGSTPGPQRAKLVEEFQNGDVPLFLISLKAGGLGLNLTAADYVIHLDPWWNPAIEDQASDRSHRIGQKKPVTVYRLIAADTIEDKILRLHAHKKSLADALLEGSSLSARLSKDDILALLTPTD